MLEGQQLIQTIWNWAYFWLKEHSLFITILMHKLITLAVHVKYICISMCWLATLQLTSHSMLSAEWPGVLSLNAYTLPP